MSAASNNGSALQVTGTYGFTQLTARMSNHSKAVEDAAEAFQHEYRTHVPGAWQFLSPTANHIVGDLVSVLLPLGLKDRLEIISKFVQMLISYDDRVIVIVHVDPNARPTVLFIRSLRAALASFSPPSVAFIASSDPYEIIMGPILDALSHITPNAADPLLAAVENWFFNKTNRHNKSFDSLPEYLDYRIRDFGVAMWNTIITYTLDVHIHPGDRAGLTTILEVAFKSVVLVDDIYGHNRDLNVTSNPVNSITLIAKNNPGLTEPMVRDRAQQVAIAQETLFIHQKMAWKEGHPAINARYRQAHAYLDGLTDFVAGWHVWAATCPRYLYP